jgi:hypothetical protein
VDVEDIVELVEGRLLRLRHGQFSCGLHKRNPRGDRSEFEKSSASDCDSSPIRNACFMNQKLELKQRVRIHLVGLHRVAGSWR